MPGLNMTKLNEIAAEWDPTPFLEAIEKAAAVPVDPQPGGAMDMSGAVAQPNGPSGQPPMNFASMMGTAPAGMAGMAAGMGGMGQMLAAPSPQQQVTAPAVAPRGPGPRMQYPGMPQIPQVPSLRDILGGR